MESITLRNLSCGTDDILIGSIVVTFPNLTSGMYNAQTTCAQPRKYKANEQIM